MSFVLLSLAIVAVWCPAVPIGHRGLPAWLPMWGLALAAGLVDGVVQAPGLIALLALTALALASVNAALALPLRAGLTSAVALLALALALHRLPGFVNPVQIDALRLSGDAVAFTQYLNFDKGAAGLVLLAVYGRRWGAPVAEGRRLGTAVLMVTLTVLATLAVALAIGQVRFDPKWPPQVGAFLWANLFFTCVAEEAFFRGLLQSRVAAALRSWRAGPAVAVGLSAVSFGVAHAAGGAAAVGLATVVGLGCAVAYARTGRIEVPVMAHFAVNAVHFVGFTYPSLA